MTANDNPGSAASPFLGSQTELPGIPQGSSLTEILAAYDLAPREAPGALRRYRHELLCGGLRAIVDVWVTSDGLVDSFRIWSLRPRRPAPAKTDG